MKNLRVAAVAAIATAALMLIIGAGYSYGPGTAATLSLNRNLTAPEAGKAMAYQCVRDFHQCLSGIQGSTFWSTDAYALEQSGCCYSLAYCTDVADDLNGRVLTGLATHFDNACGVDSTAGEERRSAMLEALRAASVEQGL